MCIIGLQKLIANSVFGQQIVCSDAGWILLYAVTSGDHDAMEVSLKNTAYLMCHAIDLSGSTQICASSLTWRKTEWDQKGELRTGGASFLSKRLFNLFNLFQDPT